MTKLRGFIPTTLMLITLMLGATVANAGIVVSERASTESAKADEPRKEQTLTESFGSFLKKAATFAITGIVVSE